MKKTATKTLHRYHRKLGVWLLIPMLAWLISGLMHPLMSNILTVDVATKTFKPTPIRVPAETLSLQTIMQMNGLQTIDQARFVLIDNTLHYQLQQRITPETIHYSRQQNNPNVSITYYNAQTGKLTPKGDEQYAQQLATHFMGNSAAKVTDIERINQFNTQYPSINRLLPVYRVRFNNAEKTDIYVDTRQSRYSSANNGGRRIANWVFRNLHTWSFLGGTTSLWRLIPVTLLSVFSLVMGVVGLALYTIMYSRFKKQRASKKGRVRRWHRTIGLLVSLSFIGFASSGLHTVIMKFLLSDEFAFQPMMSIHADSLKTPPFQSFKNNTSNFSLARMGNNVFYQLHQINKGAKTLDYINASTGKPFHNGDAQYAVFLAKAVADNTALDIIRTESRTRFGRDYPRIFKRLPVQKVSVNNDSKLNYFIETQTGSIAGKSERMHFYHMLHFRWLHKYHFLDKWMSRSYRDLILTILTLIILGLTIMGGVLLFKRSA